MVAQNNHPHIEKRRFKRISVPTGTTAVFNDETDSLSTVFVMNISEAGLLLCDYFPEIRYDLDKKMHDIFINILSNDSDDGLNTENRVSLLINQGVVVRSSMEKALNRVFYGVSFLYCNPSMQEKIRDLVKNTPEY